MSQSCMRTLRSAFITKVRKDKLSGLVGPCQASACAAFKDWARRAAAREAEANRLFSLEPGSGKGRTGKTSANTSSSTSNSDDTSSTNPTAVNYSALLNASTSGRKGRRLIEESNPDYTEVEQRQNGGFGVLCSQRWHQDLLHWVTSNNHLISAFNLGYVSAENISEGVTKVCDHMRQVERSLANESASQCEQWPESCWPIPHVPFSLLSDFPRRKYLVVAFTMEQMSNARTHLAEAARVAEESGRILVLPNVSAVGKGTRVEWVSPEFFLLTARAAFLNPSVGFVCVKTESLHRPCFKYRELVEILGQVLTFAMGHVPMPSNTIDVKMPQSKDVFNMLLHAWSDRDVVVWMKTTFQRIEYVPRTDVVVRAVLPYRPTWHDTAARIVAKLPKPVIGVHFRSEFISWNVPRSESWRSMEQWLGRKNTRRASRGALRWLRQHVEGTVMIDEVVPAVNGYDPGGSGCVYGCSGWLRQHVEGTMMIDEIMPAVNGYDPVFIVAYIPFTGRYCRLTALKLPHPIPPHPCHFPFLSLPGIVSILDKLVTAKADIFVGAERYCGGKRGFESDILQHRDEYGQPADSVVRWGYEE
ncbi:unnamed protein product [Closterium sp. Yama58-4]|nr:unnamed protein product [Closterium sp. Yama58-4]